MLQHFKESILNKFVISLFLILTTFPAYSQQLVTPGEKATQILLNREMNSHLDDLSSQIELELRLNSITDQLAKVTKERDDLKNKYEPVKDSKSKLPETPKIEPPKVVSPTESK